MRSRSRGKRAIASGSASGRYNERLRQLIERTCHQGAGLAPVGHNMLLEEFSKGVEARKIRQQFEGFSTADRLRMRFPRDSSDPERQGDLIILKKFRPDTKERGVILIKYSESIRRFAALYNVAKLAPEYTLVFEPSWWGYEDLTFLYYLGSDLDVVIESPWRRDYNFIKGLRSNLIPIRLGAGDWIDGDVFTPNNGGERTFDLVMVSAWSPVKRHEDLFRSLSVLRERGRELRVALVGYPNGWTRNHIEAKAAKHGILDSCNFFESVPHAEVARIVSRSRGYVLLSRREGANRALYEALFCDTPVIVSRDHHGVNLDHVTGQTGILFEDNNLEGAILKLLDKADGFRARGWALEHTGYHNATQHLNEHLRLNASGQGRPWTAGIVEKKAAPNLRYGQPGMYKDFEKEYRRLSRYLRPA